jgi:hypothetical protein
MMRHPLQVQFADDMFFAPIVEHLLGHTTGGTIGERKRAAHPAAGFIVEVVARQAIELAGGPAAPPT